MTLTVVGEHLPAAQALDLTDAAGGPPCARVLPPAITWTAA